MRKLITIFFTLFFANLAFTSNVKEIKKSRFSDFEVLPHEIKVEIAHFLNFQDVAQLLLVSKSFGGEQVVESFLINYFTEHWLTVDLKNKKSVQLLKYLNKIRSKKDPYLKIAVENIGEPDLLKVTQILELIKNAKFLKLSGINSPKEELNSAFITTVLQNKMMPELEYLAINHEKVDLNWIKAISDIKSLKQLHLFFDDIDDGSVQEIAKMKNLTHLTLEGGYRLNKPKIETIKAIAQMDNLKSLSLNYLKIGVQEAKIIANMINLKELQLKSNNIGNDGILEITEKMSNLKNLDLSDNRLDDEGAKMITNLINLETLQLQNNNIGHSGTLEITKKMSKLKNLNLSGNLLYEEGAKMITNLINLETLELAGNYIGNNAAVEIINKMHKLKALNLSHTNIDHEAAKNMTKVNNLKQLILSDNDMGDKGAQEIAKMENLEELDLAGNDIGDEGAKAIARSKTLYKLKRLKLHGNNITDNGAYEFFDDPAKQLPKLEFLSLKANDLKHDLELLRESKRPNLILEQGNCL